MNESFIVMGIETSCDETGVGVVEWIPNRDKPSVAEGPVRLLANEVASSVAEHTRYGGVVPEVASRAHLEAIVPTIRRALAVAGIKKPDAIAVTIGPGLIGALLVGVSAAKACALAWEVPLYAVNHLSGHVAVDTLEHGPMPPCIALLVSGGHTNLLRVRDLREPIEEIGATVDDAAGEAFDKVARILGLGYPGGPAIDKWAINGDSSAIAFPRGMTGRAGREGSSQSRDVRYNFSFSGLKTAVSRYVDSLVSRGEEVPIADVSASFQEAVADVLTMKALRACTDFGVRTLVMGGGATANSRIRSLAQERCDAAGITLRVPKPRLCTDNGVMIATLGAYVIASGATPSPLTVATDPDMPVQISMY